jgi:sugar/nucleoside kinase (ribokinase family)
MSTSPFDVLVVGELNADLILCGDVVPAFNQVEKLIDDASLVLGSSSAIFACGAARLGLRVAFAGKVGDDALGRFVLDQLRVRQVDASHVVVDPDLKTGLSVILNRGADRAILTFSGSIRELAAKDIDPGALAVARHLHLGSYFLLDRLKPDVPRLFAQARRRGLTTSIDTNYDPAEAWNGGLAEALKHTDVFLPNEAELCAIARSATTDDAMAALRALVPTIAVKRGRAGAIAESRGRVATASGLDVDVVDTVGAGDSFDAGFVYGFLAGWDLARTLRLACVCGSLSTRAAGGVAAQASLEEALVHL